MTVGAMMVDDNGAGAALLASLKGLSLGAEDRGDQKSLASTTEGTDTDTREFHLRRQIEWCLSDTNLSTDRALHRKISGSLPDGWLRARWLLRRLPLVDVSRTPPALVLEALKHSHVETKILEAGDHPGDLMGRLMIRRRQPLPPLLPAQFISRWGVEAVPDHRELALLKDEHSTMQRLTDRFKVQEELQLEEIGDSNTIFREAAVGSQDGRSEQRQGRVVAIGYERVLYGDHGPYIEFSREQVCWEAWPHYFDKKKFDNSYYDEYYTAASHALWKRRWTSWVPNPFEGVLMLYAQNHSVADRPYAPGQWHEKREHGYADYRPGYFYASANGALISCEHEQRQEGNWAAPHMTDAW